MILSLGQLSEFFRFFTAPLIYSIIAGDGEVTLLGSSFSRCCHRCPAWAASFHFLPIHIEIFDPKITSSIMAVSLSLTMNNFQVKLDPTYEQLYNTGRSHNCSSLVDVICILVEIQWWRWWWWWWKYMCFLYPLLTRVKTITISRHDSSDNLRTYHYCWLLRGQSRWTFPSQLRGKQTDTDPDDKSRSTQSRIYHPSS